MARLLGSRLSCGVLAVLLAACSSDALEEDADRPVEVEVQRGPLTLRWSDATQLEPARETTVRSHADGAVAILFLAPDDALVEAGEKLVELDDAALRDRRAELVTQLEAARREVAETEAALRLHAADSSAALAGMEGTLLSARFDLDTHHGREVTLEEAAREREANPWARAVDEARRALEAAQGAADRERARREAALHGARAVFDVLSDEVARNDERSAETVLRAPFAGRVRHASRDDFGYPTLRVGSVVRNRQPILDLVDTSSVLARVRIPAAVGEIGDGVVARVRVDAFPAAAQSGRVVRSELHTDPVSPRLSSSFREVWVSIDGVGELGLARGMSATVDLECAHIEDAVHVPIAAIRVEGGTRFVWKSTSDGPVRTPVKVGRYDGEHVEILAGLEAGDRVFVKLPDGTGG